MKKTIKQLNEELDEALQLNEMSMAWVDKKTNKCCWVENANTHNNEYFKYFDSFSYRKADAVARISLKEPKYLDHKNFDGKNNWKLNNKEKKELIELMNEPSKVHEGLSNWQTTLVQYNFDNFWISPLETINNTFDKEKYPKAFTLDTPMPNYMEL